jgi:hypothetical protein
VKENDNLYVGYKSFSHADDTNNIIKGCNNSIIVYIQ